jgi:hypothetical protein
MFILATFSAAGASAIWLGRITNRAARENGRLVISDQALDIGDVWSQKDFRWTLPIENKGSAQVHVQKFLASCGCVAIEPQSFSLAPGATRKINLTMDLTRVDAVGDPSESISRAFRICLAALTESTVGSTLTRWTLTGKVKSLLTLPNGDHTVHLGAAEQLIVGRPFPARNLSLKSTIPLHSVSVGANPTTVDASATVSPESDSSLVLLRIAPRQDLPAGPFESNLSLVATTASGQTLPPTDILVKGVVHSDIAFTPEMYSFAPAPVGATVNGEVVVFSRTGRPFRLDELTSTHDDLKAIAIGGAQQPPYRLSLTQHVSRPGANRRELRISVRHDDGRVGEATLPVHFVGVSAASTARATDTQPASDRP